MSIDRLRAAARDGRIEEAGRAHRIASLARPCGCSWSGAGLKQRTQAPANERDPLAPASLFAPIVSLRP
jgi:hypothetical protein